MANTFTQIYIHIVFSVKQRVSLIQNEWREELHKYITGIIQNQGHKLLAINSMPDHIHILIGMRPDDSLSELVRDLKANSSKWINEKKFLKTKFFWQEGYGAFSYSHSQLDKVIHYIKNQQEHHKKRPFKEEYISFLKKYDIPYDPKYVFDIDE
ncbi:MAG: IS200/IS605 family transposase [Ignavibacteriales bacterium]|nr:IS200/IS605 family transposase [Ignavibacteriales bacterium]